MSAGGRVGVGAGTGAQVGGGAGGGAGTGAGEGTGAGAGTDGPVEGLREERAGGVLTLVFDRPAARNALTVAMRQRLEALCAQVDDDPDVDVVVLTGTDPTFSAGADVKEIAALRTALPPTDPGGALRRVGKPVVAAVNGPCVTGGLELALSCDFVVASDRATFADTHARLGVLPRWGLSALLPRAVGVRYAKEMTATGLPIDAAEALRVGLVNHVVPHEELADRVQELADAVRRSDARAVVASLAAYDEGQNLAFDGAVAREIERSAGWVVDLEGFGSPKGQGA